MLFEGLELRETPCKWPAHLLWHFLLCTSTDNAGEVRLQLHTCDCHSHTKWTWFAVSPLFTSMLEMGANKTLIDASRDAEVIKWQCSSYCTCGALCVENNWGIVTVISTSGELIGWVCNLGLRLWHECSCHLYYWQLTAVWQPGEGRKSCRE